MRNRINSGLKIIMAVVMLVSMVHTNSVEGATIYNCTAEDSILITNVSTGYATPCISTDDVNGEYEWKYVLYNSDGSVYLYGTISGKTYIDKEKTLVISPSQGVGIFEYGGTDLEVTVRKAVPLYKSCSLDADSIYTFSNNSNYPMKIEYDGIYTIEYYIYDSTGERIKSSREFPVYISSGNEAEFLTGAYTTDEFEIYALNINEISQKSESTQKETLELDMNGLKYVIENNGNNRVYFSSGSISGISYDLYDSNGNVAVTASNSSVFITELDAGEYVDFSSTSGTTINLTYTYTGEDPILVTTYRSSSSWSISVNLHFKQEDLCFNGTNGNNRYRYVLETVSTKLSESEDKGSFNLTSVTDKTGMAYVNKWYVYDTTTGTYYANTVVSETDFNIRNKTIFYNKLMELYGDTTEFHVWVECATNPIVSSNSYELVKDIEYTFGSGSWAVAGDNCQYAGGMAFYLDGSSGSYTLTAQ